MNSRELRIGNWVQCDDGKTIVCGIEQDETFLNNGVQYRNEVITHIPLTEEWLLKLGFEHNEFKSEHYNQQVFMKDVHDNGNIKTITVKISSSSYTIVTKYEVLLTNEYRWGEQLVCRVYWNNDLYVHQLQNLYFALTNEELTYEQ